MKHPLLAGLAGFSLILALGCGSFTGTTADDGDAPDRPADKPSSGDKTPSDASNGSSGSSGSGGKAPLMLPGTKSGPGDPEIALSAKQCSDLTDGGPVKGPDCVTDTIECGQTIIGHTVGGTKKFDTRFYEMNFCWPGTIQRDGGDERVYKFRFPPGAWRAKFVLDTPCADLDVVAFTWDKSTCPGNRTEVRECDSRREAGSKREFAEAVTDGRDVWTDWLVVVEGIGQEEGPFALTVQCTEGVQ
jgi:hypothetical protein